MAHYFWRERTILKTREDLSLRATETTHNCNAPLATKQTKHCLSFYIARLESVTRKRFTHDLIDGVDYHPRAKCKIR